MENIINNISKKRNKFYEKYKKYPDIVLLGKYPALLFSIKPANILGMKVIITDTLSDKIILIAGEITSCYGCQYGVSEKVVLKDEVAKVRELKKTIRRGKIEAHNTKRFLKKLK